MIATQPSATATAGQAFAVQPVIYIEDQDGNIETSDNTTVVSVALASGNGLPEGTTSVTVKDGVATFAGLNEITAGTIALEFSADDGLTAGPSNNIVVSPAAPFRLVIHTQPSSTATAGQPFGTQPVIDELDQYGNLETSDNSTVITASLSFGNGPLAGHDHGDRRGRRGDVHQPRRQRGRDHLARFLRRRPVRRTVQQHRHQPRAGHAARDPDTTLCVGDSGEPAHRSHRDC